MNPAVNQQQACDTLKAESALRLLDEAELDKVGGGIEFSAFGYTFSGGESFAPGFYYASISNSGGTPIYYSSWQCAL